MGRIKSRKKAVELSKEEKNRRAREFVNAYARYSGIAFQMIVLIGGGAYLGIYLDEKYATKPVWTVIFSLLGVVLSLLSLYKSLVSLERYNRHMEQKRKKDNDTN
ncbi:MAG: AtpZ/AtpI family protein [Flavobacteriales bacterium]|nr:AtpZ/AtpI family protein [Flavobacteriales bacterium]